MNHYTRKLRVLKNLISKLQVETNEISIKELRSKVKRLLAFLRPRIPYFRLKKTLNLCLLAFGLCIGTAVTAQNFAEPIINPFGIFDPIGFGFAYPAVADMDNDGDLDILRGGYFLQDDGSINVYTYYENVGSPAAPSYTTAVFSPFDIGNMDNEYIMPMLVDIDGDGLIDLVTKKIDDGQFLLRRNVGTPEEPSMDEPIDFDFGLEVYLPFYGISFHKFADIDSDGDLDLFTSINDFDVVNYEYDPKLVFYENIGSATSPEFTSPVLEPFNVTQLVAEWGFIPSFGDLDGDGDLDLMGGDFANPDGSTFVYYENIGTSSEPDFASMIVNPFNLFTPEDLFIAPELVDMDNDNDLDLIVGNYFDILYIENDGAVGVNEIIQQKKIILHPNPTKNKLEILCDRTPEKAIIYDLLGNQVKETYQTKNLSVESLNSGTYFITVFMDESSIKTMKFVKE